MKQKLPRTHKELQRLVDESYYRGVHTERSSKEADQKEKDRVFTRQQQQARLEALRQITHAFSAFGQMMRELTEAMKSEAGQL